MTGSGSGSSKLDQHKWRSTHHTSTQIVNWTCNALLLLVVCFGLALRLHKRVLPSQGQRPPVHNRMRKHLHFDTMGEIGQPLQVTKGKELRDLGLTRPSSPNTSLLTTCLCAACPTSLNTGLTDYNEALLTACIQPQIPQLFSPSFQALV